MPDLPALPSPARPSLAPQTLLGRHGLPLALVLGAVLLGGFPLLGRYSLHGHDAGVYPTRLIEFHENVRHGIIPPRWAPDLAGGHGIPVFVGCPPFLLAVAECFVLAGVSIARSHNLALLLLYAASALAMYGAALAIGGRGGAVLASVAWLFAPYTHVDLYVRHAAAEYSGYMMLPLVLFAARLLAEPGRRHQGFLLGTIAVAATATAHPLTLLIATPLLLALAGAGSLARRSAAPLRPAAAAIALGLVIASFYWGPLLIERADVGLTRLTDVEFANHFVEPHQLGNRRWGFGGSLAGPHDGMSQSLGPAHLLLGAFGALLGLRSPQRRVRAATLTLAAVAAVAVLLTLDLSAPLWRASYFLQHLQFPWRFVGLASLALSGLAAATALGHRLAAPLGIALVFAFNLGHIEPSGYRGAEWSELTPRRLAETRQVAGWSEEYRPRWMPSTPRPTREAGRLQGTIRQRERTPTRRVLEVAALGDGPAELTITYYPGWRVRLDGRDVPIRPSPVGLIELDVPRGTHTIEATFERIPSRRAFEMASAAGVALLAGIAVLGGRRRRM